LEERENHSEKTLAQLYDPDKMPDGLREAHHQLDLAVERCYRSKPFESDEERLEYLFKLYEQMIEEDIRVNNEFYVCPVFNQAIRDSKRISVFNIEKMWGLGTPEDLDFYIKNFKNI
jgi:hypothetical protein